MTAAHVQGEYRDTLLKQIPLGRIGKPEDVAEAVRFFGFLSRRKYIAR